MSIIKQNKNNINKKYAQSDFATYCQDVTYFENLLDHVPVGIVVGYIPHNLLWSTSQINDFLIEYNFKVCDGSLYNNPNSPIYNGPGRYLPFLTDKIFLLGSTTMGNIGGSNFLSDHQHNYLLTTQSISYFGSGTLPGHPHPGVQTYQSPTSEHNHDHYILISQEANDAGYYLTRYANTYQSGTPESYVEPRTHLRHSHSWSASVGNRTINIAHTHSIDFSSGAIGVGLPPSSTDNRPNFLKVLFIQKVQYNIY